VLVVASSPNHTHYPLHWMLFTREGFRRNGGLGRTVTANSRRLLLIKFVGQAARQDPPLQDIIENGGVGVWLKPAVLKNKNGHSLSC
jgi:hypothetical protein